jgi:Protein of unknown function (DUF2849)
VSKPAKPFQPVILIANHLLDGDVVFWGGADWVLDHRKALVATDAHQAEALSLIGSAAYAANHIVDAETIAVTLSADMTPEPIHMRDFIRTRGPTTRTDLGKQAD